MKSRRLKFAIFGNIYQAKKSAGIRRVLSFLQSKGADIFIERDFSDFLTYAQNIDLQGTSIIDSDDFDADFVISIGGDGTLLKAASHVGDKDIPIIGVNAGRLGFLADAMPDDTQNILEDIFSGRYSLEEHPIIMVSTDSAPIATCPFALNDIAVLKRDNASMITLRVSVNGEYTVTYQADGLIISTPTGSTAYSLSNGGPIIAPSTGTLCLTPVAPHSLNIRPIVIPDTADISIEVESRTKSYLVAVDGRSEKCSAATRLNVRKAPYTIKIIKREDWTYFGTLRNKMMWGADTRN